MRTGRNEACPCGSGKKFKNCCAGKQKLPRGLVLLIAAIATIAAIGLLPILLADKKTDGGTLAPALPASRATRPPGPAPAGKVWSAEHGHWHDAAPAGAGSPVQVIPGSAAPGVTPGAAATVPAAPRPQPPGPAPAGKVWSAEHGHWHDAPTQ